MPVVCLLALGASHSRHHDRYRAAVDGGDCVAGPWDGLGLAAAAGGIVLVVGLACFAFGSEHSCVGPRARYDLV